MQAYKKGIFLKKMFGMVSTVHVVDMTSILFTAINL
jgi:hypothetical protein